MTDSEHTPALPDGTYRDLPPEVQQQLQALEAQVRDLQASQQRAAALFEHAPVPSFLLSPEGRIQDVNPLGVALVGLSREALTGRLFIALLPPDAQRHFAALLEQVFEQPVPRRGEGRLLRDHHPLREIRLDLVAAEALDRCHLVVTDLTLGQEARRPLHDDPKPVDTPHQEQLDRVRALNEELEQVIASTLDQFQPSVGRIMSALGLLRRAQQHKPEQVERLLRYIEQADQQLFAILESVRRYLQLQRMHVRIRTVDLNAVLQQVLREVQPLLVDRDVRITHDVLPVVQGDSQVLQAILSEYVSNALKFTRSREQARIHVIARDIGTADHLGVEDNGVGFDLQEKDRLFRLFQRGTTSARYEGAGLGLAVVRRLCERFGGRVWGEGVPEQGATFWLAWPKQLQEQE